VSHIVGPFPAGGLSQVVQLSRTCFELRKALDNPWTTWTTYRQHGQPVDNLRTTRKHALTWEVDNWTTWDNPPAGKGPLVRSAKKAETPVLVCWRPIQ
jgi:hypothetical protein